PEYFSRDMDRDEDGEIDVCVYGDCDRDGIDNRYELEVLGAVDCNADDIPDPCQWELDCDGNFLLDSCEYGTGLVGSYYLSEEPGEFSTFVMRQVDPAIEFDWGNGSPDERIPNDRFAVRWTGTITATDEGGIYRIIGYNVDDGFRLWIDGVRLIDEWSSSSGTDHVVPVNFEANSRHEIRIEYYEDGGTAKVGLKWRPPSADEPEFVPSENLLPMVDLDGDLIPDGCTPDCDQDGISDQVEIEVGSALDCNENGVPDECDLAYFEESGVIGYWRFEVDTGITFDSGPNNLQATSGNVQASADVPVNPIPRSSRDNLSSLDNGGVGRLEVVDDGSLSLIDTRFTSEAWIQLDQLAPDAVNSSSRQWLFMKKNPTSDGRIEWAVLVQGGNIADSCDLGVFGKQGPYTGRELVFVAAAGSDSGTQKWCVVSEVEINDNDWHHISVAFDPNRSEVRFSIDGVLDIQPFESRAVNPNSHPLCIAAHRNGEGNWNQQLKGRIDEVRIRRGLPLQDTMLNVPYEIVSEDANGNGVPDECKIADCPADFNGDGFVLADDLGIMLVAWGAGSGPEDLDGNGEVNGADLGLLFASWGACP
ncbi:MAG: PA14 domain-containing protein, partial [Phycisphaerales bacterium]|nr:PA14 domain-containing protein [Phycisphaerales bacterium]